MLPSISCTSAEQTATAQPDLTLYASLELSRSTHAGLRDRALIGLMVYSFARIGAALGMTVEDVYTQNRRQWVRQREKGGKRHAMPCHPQPRRISRRLS
jgi:integrase/recombinase XerC